MIRWSQNKVYFNLFLCCLEEAHDWDTYDSPLWGKWMNTMNFWFFKLLALFTKERFYLPQKKYIQNIPRNATKIIIFQIKGSFFFQNGFICALKRQLGKNSLYLHSEYSVFMESYFQHSRFPPNSCFTASLTLPLLLLHSTPVFGSHDTSGSVKSQTPKSPAAHCVSHFYLL